MTEVNIYLLRCHCWTLAERGYLRIRLKYVNQNIFSRIKNLILLLAALVLHFDIVYVTIKDLAVTYRLIAQHH